MRFLPFILLLLIGFTSCKSSKLTTKNKSEPIAKTHRLKKSKKTYNASSESLKAENIVYYAQQFEGVKYKYGGTTKRGMDCSGLIQTSYKSESILLPRTTHDLAKSGDWIDLKEVKKGDLLFFATKKNSRKVNHVGIVTNVNNDDVEFIHASTSKGVINSKLKERYWYFAFVQARRVL
ncbi:C40 family peptidase [Pontimicrobium sp. SW4]|uniref:C40 family peptidase n=1 Tax=Pontimicrobium sp. SW4 TaxID=3153519 RepID=A0AAU7BUJ0_9FLAO